MVPMVTVCSGESANGGNGYGAEGLSPRPEPGTKPNDSRTAGLYSVLGVGFTVHTVCCRSTNVVNRLGNHVLRVPLPAWQVCRAVC